MQKFLTSIDWHEYFIPVYLLEGKRPWWASDLRTRRPGYTSVVFSDSMCMLGTFQGVSDLVRCSADPV